MPPKRPPTAETSPAKTEALRRSGTLNPRPAKVQEPLFLREGFFDPQDLTQVKYEMLRQVRNEAKPISRVAATFGFSRPAFYNAQQHFAREGLAGLLPKRRGPKGGHKLTQEVLALAGQIRAQDASVSTVELLRQIQHACGVRVHRRSLERAMAAAKKKRGTP